MRLHKFFIVAAAIGLAGPLSQAQQTFRVATYNVENFILEPVQNRPLKKPFAQAKIVESILTGRPDVIALQEIGKKGVVFKSESSCRCSGHEARTPPVLAVRGGCVLAYSGGIFLNYVY